MIEIIRQEDYGDTREGGLPKEIRQMGKPDVGDRIYVEDRVYRYLHPYGETEEKAAYVLLGRFENYSGRQCTFIEGAIRLEEMDFDGELPLWNDGTWGYIYKKLKKHYDDMAIVGWAMDIKGQLPNLTGRIEKMHQKHFGGVHQVLFLMDTLEREEAFYSSRSNRLYRRDGFYIYYGKGIPAVTEPQIVQNEQPETDQRPESRIEDYERQIQEKRQKELDLQEQIYLEESLNTIEETETETDGVEETHHRPYRREYREGAYRRRAEQQEEKERTSVLSSPLVLVLVVCVLGFTAYSNHQKMNDMQNALAQINTTPIMVEEETQKNTMADEVKVEQVEGKVEKQQIETQTTETVETTAAESGVPEQEVAAEGTAETPTVEQETAVTPEIENAQETAAEMPKTTETAETAAAEIPKTTETAQTAADATNEYLKQGYYIVQKGDSVAGICRKVYQTTAMMDKLCKVNGIEDPNAIYAGQYLTLPN